MTKLEGIGIPGGVPPTYPHLALDEVTNDSLYQLFHNDK